MWARPYGEVAQHIAMLAALKPTKTEKKDDGIKKICPNCRGNGFVKVKNTQSCKRHSDAMWYLQFEKEKFVIKNLMSILILGLEIK